MSALSAERNTDGDEAMRGRQPSLCCGSKHRYHKAKI